MPIKTAKRPRAAGGSRALPKSKVASTVDPPKPMPLILRIALVFVPALILAFIVYSPSLNGDFVFDDRTLPMLQKYAPHYEFLKWIGTRPLLLATFYFNYKLFGLDAISYHALNVVLHAIAGTLIFFALTRIFEMAGHARKLAAPVAAFCAAVFVIHPVQTESVSYISSRSECLSVLFLLAAFVAFLYRRRKEISWLNSALVLVLYVCAISCKEHTIVLPGLLLLTDYFFNPGWSFRGVRRNWRLYIPVIVAGCAGVYYVLFRVIKPGSRIGATAGITVAQYLFTEFRALFVYLRLYLLPYNQSADYQYPVSYTIFEHGAWAAAIVLIAITAAAVVYRKRFPLASYGWFTMLLLFAPTSSIIPIHDPLAERRLYLPFIGLLLITAELLFRLPLAQRWVPIAGSAVLIVLAVFTFQRAAVWADMGSLWQDTLSKNPTNVRALTGMGDYLASQHQCGPALPYFTKAAELKPDYEDLYNVASAEDCLGNVDAARRAYERAIATKSTAEAWTHVALLQIKKGELDQAAASFERASRADSSYLPAHQYFGILDLWLQKWDAAKGEFNYVLAWDPHDATALRGLQLANNHVRKF